MTRTLRFVMLAVIAALALGYVGLRRANQALASASGNAAVAR